MSGPHWRATDMADESGNLAVVTGANSGLGAVVARELALHGAAVVIACRDRHKGGEVAHRIKASGARSELEVLELDLADLGSVARFARELVDRPIALLVNNAGVMMTPHRVTQEGFELQLGTNHLGHFALTGRLLPALERSPSSRIVTVSSNEHKGGVLDFDDLQMEHRYSPRAAYKRSKLANAVFAIELDRRLRARRSPAISVFAHPGYAATNLQSSGPTDILKRVLAVTTKVFAQSAERGALPILYAATAPNVRGGEYYGPDGRGEIRGYPSMTRAIPAAYDPEIGARLWAVSEELTGVRFPPMDEEPAR